jgi:hypothetical protein
MTGNTELPGFTVSGNHHEIGLGLGKWAARSLKEIVPAIERFRQLERDWAGSDYLAGLEDAAWRHYPRFFRELEGIAEGAEVPFERVFIWNCRGDFPGGGDQGPAEDTGCTSFLLAPDHTGGRAIIAHNEDGEPQEDGACAFVTLRPDDGPEVRSFSNPGLLPGHTFGLNARGLVQTINHIRPFDQRPGIPRHLTCRAILASTTLDEALDHLRCRDRASGFHHSLGQVGDGRLLSVEAPASGCAIREIDKAACHANHLTAEEFSSLQQVIAPSSATRQNRGDALLDPPPGCADPLGLLGDKATRPLPIYRKTPDGPDPGFTLASAIFEIGKTRLGWQVYHRLEDEPAHEGHLESDQN